MTFTWKITWKIPPWQRNENRTHMAVTLTNVGGGQIAVNTESVRGDNATKALADLLMGPGGAGGAVLLPGIGVVVRRGINVMWMAQPPIQVAVAGDGEWDIAVEGADASDVTLFSATEARALLARLRAAYGTG